MSPGSRRAYRFGEFSLDVAEHLLRRGPLALRLQPKAFDTLRYLVERSGRLVTKDELFQHVWPNVAVTDGALARSIREVRRVLVDDAARPRFIQTVPRLGYRFIGDVAALPAAASTEAAPLRSVAVLPFVNLSSDLEQEYFADGMTDLLIAELGRTRSLRVISRTSMMRYKGTTRSLAEIGSDLNADTAVEGSVLRSGDRVRITVQLVDVNGDAHLWAESYERQVQDVMRLQREIAGDICRAVQTTLGRADDRSPAAAVVRPEVHEAYLRGRYFWHQWTREGMEKAVACFHEALGMDPLYAPACAGLADASGVGGFFGYVPPREAFPRMQALASRALELDAALPEAHASLAATRLFYDWDWAAAESGFRQALDLNPNLQAAHERYGWCLFATGRIDDAVAAIMRARDLDPLSVRARTSAAMALYFARRHDCGIDEARRAVELNPHDAEGHCTLGLNYQQTGRHSEAIAALERAVALSERRGDEVASIGYAYGRACRPDEARGILHELTRRSESQYVPAVYLAAVHAGLGERDQALTCLARAYEERSGWMIFLAVEPWWDVLRDDPRFGELLQLVGLS